METAVHTHSAIQINNYDPTRTTVLRNAFVREIRRRFRGLTRVIWQAIFEDDVFGLRAGFYQLTSPGRQAFVFPRSADKVSAFMTWLQGQVDAGILEVRELAQVGVGVEGAWTNKYIYDSYKRGVMRARYELQKAGFNVPGIDQTGGIEISLSTPFHIDRLGLLYTRTFNGLQGITAAMDTQISRVLAQGIADGDGPRLLARKLISTINGTGMGDLAITDTLGRFIPAQRRAEMLARTEIIRAHHQATIQEYRNWAVEGVIVKAEWSSAGDDRACNECLDLTGTIWTLDVIEKKIPLHPSCRCCALPHKVKEGVPSPEEIIEDQENINYMADLREAGKTKEEVRQYLRGYTPEQFEKAWKASDKALLDMERIIMKEPSNLGSFEMSIDKWIKGVDNAGREEAAMLFQDSPKLARYLRADHIRMMRESGTWQEMTIPKFINKDITLYRVGGTREGFNSFFIRKKVAENYAERFGVETVRKYTIKGEFMIPTQSGAGEVFAHSDFLIGL